MSGAELSDEDDGEWQDGSDAAAEDDKNEEEDIVWEKRRSHKPLSPVRTRGTLLQFVFQSRHYALLTQRVCIFFCVCGAATKKVIPVPIKRETVEVNAPSIFIIPTNGLT